MSIYNKDFLQKIPEKLSTIVYLYEEGYYGKKLDNKLNELKGHLNSFIPEAKNLAKKYYNIELGGET